MTCLSARNLEVSYGRLPAVRGLSFDVEDGQIVALLGANGAGTTSVIRAICGLVTVPGDPLQFRGRTLRGVRADSRVARGIATVPEGRALFSSLTVAENLRMGAYRRRDRAGVNRDFDWILSLFPVLDQRKNAPAAVLSGVQWQMLAIGTALMASPMLVLVDEPEHGFGTDLVEVI